MNGSLELRIVNTIFFTDRALTCLPRHPTSHFSFLIGDLFVHSILMEQAVDNQSTEEFFVDWFLMSVHL